MPGTIQKTIYLFKSAFAKLKIKVPPDVQEKLAIMVNQAMTSQARNFHTPEHIFDLADPDKPIITLAALFHDIVYYHIDHGFTPAILRHLKKFIHIKDSSLAISGTRPSDNQLYIMTTQIFGYKKREKLSPTNGMNEFLSALVMNSSLQSYVSFFDLLKATACIEATIPFRGKSPDGKTPSEKLAQRIRNMNLKYKLGLSLKEIEKIVQGAVTFANRDVLNFAEKDASKFLDNTWKLLPETNPALRTSGIFTIREYLTALKKMEQFMLFLKPENIFGNYKGVPGDKKLKELISRALENIKEGRDYLGIKLLASAVLDATAALSGGDAPISLFMGDVSSSDDDIRFEDLLPEARQVENLTTTIHNLLAVGRASETSFDLKNAPLANYLYSSLGHITCKKRLEDARKMFEAKMPASEFLDKFPEKVISPLLSAFSEMAFTRKDKINKYLRSRKKTKTRGK